MKVDTVPARDPDVTAVDSQVILQSQISIFLARLRSESTRRKNITEFWNVMPCWLVEIYCLFRKIFLPPSSRLWCHALRKCFVIYLPRQGVLHAKSLGTLSNVWLEGIF